MAGNTDEVKKKKILISLLACWGYIYYLLIIGSELTDLWSIALLCFTETFWELYRNAFRVQRPEFIFSHIYPPPILASY